MVVGRGNKTNKATFRLSVISCLEWQHNIMTEHCFLVSHVFDMDRRLKAKLQESYTSYVSDTRTTEYPDELARRPTVIRNWYHVI